MCVRTQADTDRLRDWLQHTPDFLRSQSTTTLTCPADPTQQASTVRRQLAFLNAIAPVPVSSRQQESGHWKDRRVVLGAIPMTPDTCEALGSLPQWLGPVLDLKLCRWPHDPVITCQRLCDAAPMAFTCWELGEFKLYDLVAHCLRKGVDKRAAKEAWPASHTITFKGCQKG